MQTTPSAICVRSESRFVRLRTHCTRLDQRFPAALEPVVHAAPDQQVSLTDLDARSMATSGRGSGVVGYNVQAAVDAQHHLIVAHEVTNVGHDRGQLSTMAKLAKTEMGVDALDVLADRGYGIRQRRLQLQCPQLWSNR